MSQKKFYVSTLTFLNQQTGQYFNFITFDVAVNSSEAQSKANTSASSFFSDKATWEFHGITTAPIKNEVIEQAAVEVLGWKKPENSQ